MRTKRKSFRLASIGLVDQFVSAASNAANIVLAAVLISSEREAGAMMLALTIGYFAVGLNRAFIGDVLLAHLPRCEIGDQVRLVRNAAATALAFGLAVGLLLIFVGTAWPRSSPIDFSRLAWIGSALPVVLLQDTGRYAAMAASRPKQALLSDATWITVQAILVAVGAWMGAVTTGKLLFAWGVGAASGAVAWIAIDRIGISKGKPWEWIREMRYISGWFTASALLGQLQVQLTAFLVTGLLGPAAFTRLRLFQTAILAPAQNLMMALIGVLVPRISRLARSERIDEVQRQVRLAALGCALMGATALAVFVPIAPRAMHQFLPRYADATSLILPIGLQACLYAVQIPYSAAMRGMQQSKALVLQSAVLAVATVVGVLFGAGCAGLVGAAWGMCLGTAIGLVTMIVLHEVAIKRNKRGEASRRRQALERKPS